MVDRITVYERCIAIQLQREAKASCSVVDPFCGQQSTDTSPNDREQNNSLVQFQYRSLPRKTKQNQKVVTPSASNPALSSGIRRQTPHTCQTVPNSNETNIVPEQNSPNGTLSSGTPTPTNPITPVGCHPPREQNAMKHFFSNSYQEGYDLYRMWVDTNAACVWDSELVRAARGTHFGGVLAGGFILVGGPPRVLAAISHAHSRALLNAPSGWIIVMLGEVTNCEATVVPKGQFTPLCDALCWVIHKLTSVGAKTDHQNVCSSLLSNFPSMSSPDPAIIHAALSDLIKQRKVFHTSRGYGIVYDDSTYLQETSIRNVSPRKCKQEPPRLLTTSEALTKAHGTTEVQEMGAIRHAAVQTDLADLLSGIWSNSTILTAKLDPIGDQLLQRTGSFRGTNRLINPLLIESGRLSRREKYQVYKGHDMTDVQIKGGDKGSVLSKILRVSQPRRRLASFNAQFPPPEWTDPQAKIIHMHSVATQTRSSSHPGGPETCWTNAVKWPPRSSTLPRRPPRPISTSPIPIDGHLRAHSASPSPAKMHEMNCEKRNQIVCQNSSASHYAVSNHSSRNHSPSLNSSSASHLDSSGYMTGMSIPIRETYHKYKTAQNNETIASSSSNRQKHSSPRHMLSKKPPPSASPHHVPYKDPRRKALLHLTQENSMMEIATPNRKSDKRISNPESSKSVRNLSSSPVRNITKTKTFQHHARSSSEDSSMVKDDEEFHEVQEQGTRKAKYDRANLQLDLMTTNVPMNNYKNIVSSPQKPEGIKNNVFHENLSSIAKGSLSDLTSKNMGYKDVNKCDKKLYSEEPTSGNNKDSDKFSPLDHKRKLKLSLPTTDTSAKSEVDIKKVRQKSVTDLADNKNEKKIKDKTILSPLDDIHSVKTYPSLSELNLNFSSFTAQKILQGVSVNSIDTLVEVNLIAEKRKQVCNAGVTNTDFGFV